MGEMLIQVRKVENAKSLKALADLTISLSEGEFTIRRIRVIHQDGKSPWIAFPQESSYKNGEQQYYQICEISRKLKKVIEDKILEEYGKF